MKKQVDLDDLIVRDFQFKEKSRFEDEPIAELPISTRVWRVLRKLGVENVGDLVKLSERELKGTEGLGNKSLKEIKTLIGEMNLSLSKAVKYVKTTD
ncbi:MAG TPA: DNA-directed RNA polymerase subunit alpha C-terminal domain-containing protein [bacterium]|nr:DNA-directed RNA polymerase subunit alpha C-terminal domain-containing protein [bacterium]